jgi:hypothetical protein
VPIALLADGGLVNREETRMADKRKAPDAPEGAPRRKRAVPTIDLTATDVTPADITPADVTPPAAEPAAQQQAASEPPPPPPEEPKPTVETVPPAPEPAAPAWRDSKLISLLAAGVAGGVVVAIVMGALWYSSAQPPAPAGGNDTSAQIASLQQQVHILQSRPAVAVDTRTIELLNQRVARMETTLANLSKGDASITERLAAAESATKVLGVAVTALNQRNDDASANATRAREQADAAEKAVTQLRGSVQDAAKDASAAVAPAQLDALQQRLAALEQSSKAARDEIAKTADAEVAARRALSAAGLRNAVVSGAAYSGELAQTKSLGADDATLTLLAPFAASGVPSAALLAQELRAQIPAMVKASGAPAPKGGFFERLEANASRLVRVTPVDAPRGDDPSAVLARIEIAGARADIPAALADLGELPEAARAPAQAWIAKAKARQAALDAANTLAADTARALGSR